MKATKLLVGAWVCLLLSPAIIRQASAQGAGPGRVVPSEVVTAVACGECHASEQVVWEKTTHATGFKTLHRKDSAEAIAGRMGIKLIKRDSMCLDCHYTPTEQNGRLRAVSGVSCESCHGSGQDWIDVHNDYGGKGLDHTTESAEHREMRIAASRAAGMRRPSDIYPLVSSCFACHTVPNEELVNVGKHSVGSTEFELVARVEQIRHNFLDSFLTGDGGSNAEMSEAHKRRLYVVGRALDLEYSLRGLAQATESGVYFKAMQRRLRTAVGEMRVIAKVGDFPFAEQMVELVRGVKARVDNGDELVATADRVGEMTRAFLETYDESPADSGKLAVLDPLIRGETVEIEDEPPELPSTDVIRGQTVVAEAGSVEGVPSAGVPAAGVPAAGTAARTRVIPAVEAEGRKRTHLRPASDFDTLPATACQKCHGEQNAWWFEDPHYAAVEPFLDRARRQSHIARLWGLSPERMARGDSLCMDCHGTVATARAAREVQDGVGCQSCHGPGAAFLEPHQEGEKSQGRNRPGFQKALDLGMKDLANLEVRMRNCASCHYVTDPRLVSSGHPTGADFDIVAGMRSVKHWEGNLESDDALRRAYRSVLAQRGPIPKVRQARLAQRVTEGGTPVADGSTVEAGGAPRSPRVRAPRPVDRRSRGASAGRSVGRSAGPGPELDLPALPEAPEGTPLEELLRLIKDRVELLYEKLGGDRVHGGRQEGDGS